MAPFELSARALKVHTPSIAPPPFDFAALMTCNVEYDLDTIEKHAGMWKQSHFTVQEQKLNKIKTIEQQNEIFTKFQQFY